VGITLCNNIPTKIKQVENFRDFKTRLKTFLSDHLLYSLNEFCIFEEDNGTNNYQT
jgi:hypothetical protein